MHDHRLYGSARELQFACREFGTVVKISYNSLYPSISDEMLSDALKRMNRSLRDSKGSGGSGAFGASGGLSTYLT